MAFAVPTSDDDNNNNNNNNDKWNELKMDVLVLENWKKSIF
jgi:hypothetical protein